MAERLLHTKSDQAPLVRLVACAYNAEAHVARFFECIAQQTFTNFQLVFVDDGSNDNTAFMAKEYGAALGNRFVFLQNTANEGLSAARNRGLNWVAEHPSTYVGFLDVDDWFEPNYVQSLVQAARTYEADLVIGGVVRCNAETDAVLAEEMVHGPKGVVGCPQECSALARINPCSYAKLFRFAPIANLRFRNILRSEDLCYLFEALPSYSRVVFTNQAHYHYCVQDQSLTARFGKTMHDSMHNTFAEMLPADQPGPTGHYRMLFEAQVFLHSSIGGVLRRAEGGESAVQLAREEKQWLDQYMPNWRANPYIIFGAEKSDGVESVRHGEAHVQRSQQQPSSRAAQPQRNSTHERMREFAVKICAALYKRGAFALFPKAYMFARLVSRREFRE